MTNYTERTQRLEAALKAIDRLPPFTVEHYEFRPWKSMSFTGEVHKFTMLFDSDPRTAFPSPPYKEIIEEHVFSPLPGYIVAPATVTSSLPMEYPVSGVLCTIEILLVEGGE